MIKKIVFSILCNDAVGSILLWIFPFRIPMLRWRGYYFNISPAQMPKRIIASIFWGFYESAEIRLLDRYFDGNSDVIECGASSGIVSAFIVSKFTDTRHRYIGIEANRALHDVWELNVSRYNKLSNALKLVHAAIYYLDDWVRFSINSNPTSSSVEQGVSMIAEKVRAVRLSDIVIQEAIGPFTLVSDIEGGEAAIFLHEDQVFMNCRKIFIELHDTAYQSVHYTVIDLKKLIESRSFRLVDNIGNVYYFERC